MAEKKKMSVAEILAAARKTDAKEGEASAPAKAKTEEAPSAAATGETEEAVVAAPAKKASRRSLSLSRATAPASKTSWPWRGPVKELA